MGNSSSRRLTIRYENRRFETQSQFNSFLEFNNAVKNFFNIPQSTPIVFKSGQNFLSTSHKWEIFMQTTDLGIEVWNQIEPLVQNKECLKPFIKHIFKIQNSSEKIIGMGFFISKNLCLVPKSLIKLENFEDFVSSNSIKYFDETEGQFSTDKYFTFLGNHSANQHFALFEVERDVEDYEIKYPKVTREFKFHSIYMNSKYQMLSAQRFTHYSIDCGQSFRLRDANEYDLWVPGAVLISDQGEVLGIYQGGIGKMFTPMNIIYQEIARILESSLENDEVQTRNLLLELNNIEISIPWLTDIMNNLNELVIPVVQVHNPLTAQNF